MPPRPSSSPGTSFEPWSILSHRQGDELDDGNVRQCSSRMGAVQPSSSSRKAFVSDNQSALELTGIFRIDAEVGGELHGAAHALRDKDEGRR